MSVALAISLRSISGRSLAVAIRSGHCFGAEVGRYRPRLDALEPVFARLGPLVHSGQLAYIHHEGFLLHVGGAREAVESIFDCRVALEPRPSAGPGEPPPPHQTVPLVRFETPPRLAGLEDCIDAIEPIGVWPISATNDKIACAVAGHDYDIIAFDGPCGLLECMRCRHLEGFPPPWTVISCEKCGRSATSPEDFEEWSPTDGHDRLCRACCP